MVQKLRPEFHVSLAQSFVKEVQLLKSTHYSFLGKVSAWPNGDVPPTTVIDSLDTEISTRDDIIYMSKIMPNDISLCAKRHDWVSGVVFARWDSTIDMSNANFYVLTSSYAVYKCLDNNGGSPSTVEPTGNGSYGVITTADGYIWKYMYTIPAFKRVKFINPNYIPTQKSITDTFYNKGSISDVIVANSGSGYTSVSQTTITVGGPGTGAVLVPYITESGSIVSVKVVNGGSGFTTTPTLTVVGAGTKLYPETVGTSAVIEAVVSGGIIRSVIVKDPGISYSQNTTTNVTITGDGTGAVVTPVVYNGSIIDVIIENGGTNYSHAKLTVNGTGSGADLTTNFGIGDIVSDQNLVEQLTAKGSIYAIKITNPGAGYILESSPAVTIVGDGTGATAQAILVNDKIAKIKMLTYGSGYTYANVVIAPSDKIEAAGGINASAVIIKSPLNGHGFDAPNELFGDTVCISSILNADEVLSTINQDYRQYGILRNPNKLGSTEFTTKSKELLCFKTRMLSTTGLSQDMILNQNGLKYTVVKFDSSYAYLQPLHSRQETPLGTLSDTQSSSKFTVTEIISSPTINKYSGQLVLMSAENQFTFTSEQNIALKTYIKC